jgi:putative ABC transport system substrate-binding protein
VIETRRRLLFAALSVPAGLALPGTAFAQQETKVPKVGVLLDIPPGIPLEPFQKGLEALGWSEGRTLLFEVRTTRGVAARGPRFAAELAGMELATVLAFGATAAQAMVKSTTKIPIAFAVAGDPIALGLGASLQRPGGNATGVASFVAQQPLRQLEVLKEALPGIERIALVSDFDLPRTDGVNAMEQEYVDAANSLGLQPQLVMMRGPTPNIDASFKSITDGRAQALLVLDAPITMTVGKWVVEVAGMHRMPTMFPGGQRAAGGLLTCGMSLAQAIARLPAYVDKVLKGTKPDELPIELISKMELIVNQRAAKTLGITLPPDLLKKADEVLS